MKASTNTEGRSGWFAELLGSVSFVALMAGVGMIHVPAALILAGALGLAAALYLVIPRGRRKADGE